MLFLIAKGLPIKKRNGLLVAGCAGLFIGAGHMTMSMDLSFGELDRPGAAIFPFLVSILLILASLGTVWEGLHTYQTETVEFPIGANRWRLIGMIVTLSAYVLILPWLGQLLASTIFATLMMRLLSTLTWRMIFVKSIALSAAVYVVFIVLLRVPMPRGILAF